MLPLVWDPFSDVALTLANTARSVGFLGVLSATGRASARFDTLGALPSYAVGTTIYYAYVLYPPIAFASNAVVIDIDN